jgi:hypothetical protein
LGKLLSMFDDDFGEFIDVLNDELRRNGLNFDSRLLYEGLRTGGGEVEVSGDAEPFGTSMIFPSE